jgi:Na+/proline symporter
VPAALHHHHHHHPTQVYNNLHVMSEKRPVAHNKEGSFLTMWSQEGLVFGIINVIGNFGTVFVDQAYCESHGLSLET